MGHLPSEQRPYLKRCGIRRNGNFLPVKEQALTVNAEYFLPFWELAEKSLTPPPACFTAAFMVKGES